ncbi:MAG TPA: transcriptional repressor [Bacteroidales bacterium]|nr:transcriptional repressor [Bacteroidales bacterium]HRX95499.1 transcriptional repressor [Bacteroidales bacterium]
MSVGELKNILAEKGLKITPQRLVVMEALSETQHPTADNIIGYIRQNHPNIAIGTVYKTLETFVDNGIINKVKTEKDVMRYDSIIDHHHHLYCSESDRIEDYFDEELNQLLTSYFANKQIPGFQIEDVKLQILGKFKNEN